MDPKDAAERRSRNNKRDRGSSSASASLCVLNHVIVPTIALSNMLLSFSRRGHHHSHRCSASSAVIS